MGKGSWFFRCCVVKTTEAAGSEALEFLSGDFQISVHLPLVMDGLCFAFVFSSTHITTLCYRDGIE